MNTILTYAGNASDAEYRVIYQALQRLSAAENESL